MAEGVVRDYDPQAIIIVFGTHKVTGYAEGTFVSIDSDGDKFETYRGSDGDIDRVKKNVFNYIVTLTLKQTSVSNDVFSRIHAEDLLLGTGKRPFLVKDLNGTELFVAPQAWIVKDPTDEFGDSIESREWMFHTGIASKHTGGSIR